MATRPSGLDALAQREAILLRLNDEIDADTHAAISDAERCLREPPVPPPSASAAPSRALAATPATTRRSLLGGGNAHVTANGNNTNRPLRFQAIDTPAGREAQAIGATAFSLGAAVARSAGVGRTRGAARGGGGGGPVDSPGAGGRGSGAVTEGMGSNSGRPSPSVRLSERVMCAARNSGERNRRKAAGAISSGSSPDGGGMAGQSQRSSSESSDRSREQGATPSAGRPESGGSQASTRTREDADGQSGGVPTGIGDEAAARFLKAKLAACQVQLQDALRAHRASQQEALELRRQSALEQEHARRVARQLQQLQQTKEKENKAKAEEAANAATLSKRVADLERELGASKRDARQAETDSKSLEVRLHRALEEVSKQKEAVRQTRGQNKDLGQGQRVEVARLEGQCRHLEKQKLELLAAFKKQLKLIDILKRQKFHLEASRVLGFTEEEFIKTLDWQPNSPA